MISNVRRVLLAGGIFAVLVSLPALAGAAPNVPPDTVQLLKEADELDKQAEGKLAVATAREARVSLGSPERPHRPRGRADLTERLMVCAPAWTRR